MADKRKNWFQNLGAGARLALLFFSSLVLWLLVEWGFDLLIPPASNQTFGKRLLDAAIMATFWTLFMDWKSVKAVFKKKRMT